MLTENEVQFLSDVLWNAQKQASSDDAWKELQNARVIVGRQWTPTRELLFTSAGHDATGTPLYRVGDVADVHAQRVFASSLPIIAVLHKLVITPGDGVPAAQVSTAANATEGARGKLKTAIELIRTYCPQLADALREGIKLKRSTLRYQPEEFALHICADLGNVLETSVARS
jgi:hypothetical protein